MGSSSVVPAGLSVPLDQWKELTLRKQESWSPSQSRTLLTVPMLREIWGVMVAWWIKLSTTQSSTRGLIPRRPTLTKLLTNNACSMLAMLELPSQVGLTSPLEVSLTFRKPLPLWGLYLWLSMLPNIRSNCTQVKFTMIQTAPASSWTMVCSQLATGPRPPASTKTTTRLITVGLLQLLHIQWSNGNSLV